VREYFAGCPDPAKAYAYAVAAREKTTTQRLAADAIIDRLVELVAEQGWSLAATVPALEAERDRLFPQLGARDFPLEP